MLREMWKAIQYLMDAVIDLGKVGDNTKVSLPIGPVTWIGMMIG